MFGVSIIFSFLNSQGVGLFLFSPSTIDSIEPYVYNVLTSFIISLSSALFLSRLFSPAVPHYACLVFSWFLNRLKLILWSFIKLFSISVNGCYSYILLRLGEAPECSSTVSLLLSHARSWNWQCLYRTNRNK